jgi:hypothetical protein
MRRTKHIGRRKMEISMVLTEKASLNKQFGKEHIV